MAFVDPTTGETTQPLTPGGPLAGIWAAGDDVLVLTWEGDLTRRSAGAAQRIDDRVTAAAWVDAAARTDRGAP